MRDSRANVDANEKDWIGEAQPMGVEHARSLAPHPGAIKEKPAVRNALTVANRYEDRIEGEREWVSQGQVGDPYEQEHFDLIESIRSGKLPNEAKQVAEGS